VIEIVAAHGGTEDDYLAMKLIVACQSLFLIHLQAGVVRSQLSAMVAFLRKRSNWQQTQKMFVHGELNHEA
jgi:hypothetical protein